MALERGKKIPSFLRKTLISDRKAGMVNIFEKKMTPKESQSVFQFINSITVLCFFQAESTTGKV